MSFWNCIIIWFKDRYLCGHQSDILSNLVEEFYMCTFYVCIYLINFSDLLVKCMLYISTSVWVLRMSNAGRNSHFQRFWNLQQNSAKNRVFLHSTKTLVDCFTPQKISFFLKKHNSCIFWPALCVLRHCVFWPALGWLVKHCYILSRYNHTFRASL